MPSDRGDKQYEFWSIFLFKCKGKTHLFDGRKPVRNHRIGPPPKNYMHFQCDVTDKKTEAQAYIDFGYATKDKDGAEIKNKDLYDSLRKNYVKIEQAFGHSLVWRRCENKGRSCRRCAVVRVFEGKGLLSPRTEWPSICDELIDAIVKLEEVLRPGAPALRAGKS